MKTGAISFFSGNRKDHFESGNFDENCMEMMKFSLDFPAKSIFVLSLPQRTNGEGEKKSIAATQLQAFSHSSAFMNETRLAQTNSDQPFANVCVQMKLNFASFIKESREEMEMEICSFNSSISRNNC